jgi:hypothetical protein
MFMSQIFDLVLLAAVSQENNLRFGNMHEHIGLVDTVATGWQKLRPRG